MTKCCWSGCKQKGTCSISYINGEGYLYMCKKCYSDYLKHCDTREDTFREEGKSQARKEFIEMINKPYPEHISDITGYRWYLKHRLEDKAQ